jgi:hypothetical protein
MRNACNTMSRELKRKRQLDRPRRRWEYNIEMDIER